MTDMPAQNQRADNSRRNIAQLLRGAGLRPTRQRLALGALLFEGEDRHVTAELLHAEAVAIGHHVSLATVYNTFNTHRPLVTAAEHREARDRALDLWRAAANMDVGQPLYAFTLIPDLKLNILHIRRTVPHSLGGIPGHILIFQANQTAMDVRSRTLPGNTSNATAQSDQDVGVTSFLTTRDLSRCAWFFLTKSLA